jgi:hypothetical protein
MHFQENAKLQSRTYFSTSETAIDAMKTRTVAILLLFRAIDFVHLGAKTCLYVAPFGILESVVSTTSHQRFLVHGRCSTSSIVLPNPRQQYSPVLSCSWLWDPWLYTKKPTNTMKRPFLAYGLLLLIAGLFHINATFAFQPSPSSSSSSPPSVI